MEKRNEMLSAKLFVYFALHFSCYLCCYPLKSQIISNRFTSNKIFWPQNIPLYKFLSNCLLGENYSTLS